MNNTETEYSTYSSDGVLSALEFYSGIGGMHYAFKKALKDRKGKILAAFDIHEVANKVYEHNFGPHVHAVNLDNMMQASKLKKYKADVYLMSPPCQPYTRTGLQQQSEDTRSCSFLKFLSALPQLIEIEKAPKYIFIENVLGFEKSDTRNLLVDTTTKLGYNFQEFLVNPLHLGTPNSRLRYYFMAKHKSIGDFSLPELNGCTFHSSNDSETISFAPEILEFIWTSILQKNSCPKLEDFFEHSLYETYNSKDYQIPEQTFSKYSMVYDIVTPQHNRSCCFTKGYSKCVQASGSILNLGSKDNGQIREDHRYFSEYEIAQLMGFPIVQDESKSDKILNLEFPDSVSLKQRYKLLGNSLNVDVVSKLLSYLLS